jgi:altronate dehydratase small subunit
MGAAEDGVQAGQAVVVIAESDDVGTALRPLAPGERIAYRVGARQGQVTVREAIPFGHKVALRDLAQDSEVHKYGAVIGRTTAAVAEGALVHVHNLAGIRGRGDLARARAGAGGGNPGAAG